MRGARAAWILLSILSIAAPAANRVLVIGIDGLGPDGVYTATVAEIEVPRIIAGPGIAAGTEITGPSTLTTLP